MSTSTSTSTSTSITTTKASFLRSQIRLLSNPLQPPPSSSSPSLPSQTLTDLLAKLDAKLQTHNRRVFSAPSQRHVAEQLAALYWADVTSTSSTSSFSPTGEAETEPDTVFVPRDTDPGDLPATLDGLDDDDGGGGVVGKKRYAELRARLAETVERRDKARQRVGVYKRVRREVAGFERTGQVQGNLVTREGELAGELERMRVLVARVQGGLSRVDGRDGGGGGEKTEADGDEREKVRRVLDLG